MLLSIVALTVVATPEAHAHGAPPITDASCTYRVDANVTTGFAPGNRDDVISHVIVPGDGVQRLIASATTPAVTINGVYFADFTTGQVVYGTSSAEIPSSDTFSGFTLCATVTPGYTYVPDPAGPSVSNGSASVPYQHAHLSGKLSRVKGKPYVFLLAFKCPVQDYTCVVSLHVRTHNPLGYVNLQARGINAGKTRAFKIDLRALLPHQLKRGGHKLRVDIIATDNAGLLKDTKVCFQVKNLSV